MTVLSPVETKWASTQSRRRGAWWSKAKCVGRRERGHVEAGIHQKVQNSALLKQAPNSATVFWFMSKTNSAHEMKTYKHGFELIFLYISDNWIVFSLYVKH